jgi:gp37 protein
MSATQPIIDALRDHLQQAIPWVQVDEFPERPADYQFIHPVGAVLVAYQGSQFTAIEGLGHIAQQRNITLQLTVIGASLHGDSGALAILDEVRLAIVGFAPPNCLPCHLIREQFLSENAGAWQYALTVQTETQQVERRQPENLTTFVHTLHRQRGEPLNPQLKPKP